MSQTYPNKIYTNFPDAVSIRDYVKDLDITTKVFYEQYCTLVATGNFTEANKIKDEHLKNVLIDAFFFNGILDDISALQQLFHDDIESWVFNISKYAGVYSPTTKYSKFNVVSYVHEGAIQFYQAHTLEIPIATLPTNENYWTCVTLRGEKGDPGLGMSYGGLWNELMQYTTDQFIVCDNAFWICLSPNTNSHPSKTNGDWGLMLEINAALFVYDNTNSTLESTTMQNAIDELDGKVTALTKVVLSVDNWVALDDRYKYIVSFNGLKSDDCVVLYKFVDYATLTEDSSSQYDSDFAKIKSGKSDTDILTIYSLECPENDVPIYLKKGSKGTGELLFGGSAASEKNQISNVVMTITDNAAVAEGGSVKAECNGKNWSSTIKNGKAKLYASEVGNYLITVTATNGTKYTTMLVCPYFGQFSTDIYSGTLVVSCTEAGGNGKTCNVRSCDNNYTPTDAYNLTQTFDTGLELTFLGIPAGKYLVTVDDKYVFFKEIASIQNVNSVNVQLRQWLYNHGDECHWNTGGWIRCLYSSVAYSGKASAGPVLVTSTGVVNKELNQSGTKIILNVSLSAIATQNPSKSFWVRGGGKVDAYIGTKKPMNMSINKYDSFHITATNAPNSAIRVGNANNETTSTSTSTVLVSGNTFEIPISLGNTNPYFVIGKSFSEGYIGNPSESSGVQASGIVQSNPGNINLNFSSDITEIWLE